MSLSANQCKECGAVMKPLFMGLYCPNDCDKPEVLAYRAEAKRKADEHIAAEKQKYWYRGGLIPLDVGANLRVMSYIQCLHPMHNGRIKLS